MPNAWVLMTAMPPTKGHQHLAQFAASLVPHGTAYIVVQTQPGEPFCEARADAMRRALRGTNAAVIHQHETIEQDPVSRGFHQMWKDKLLGMGVKPGDYIVSSEDYGSWLATATGATFMPYDPARQLYYTKASNVRDDPSKYFDDILDEFQPFLTKTVTIFGAESTGKTTLSHDLSVMMNGHWLFEYARPYLETCGNVIDVAHMTAIWEGQAAIQRHAKEWTGKPWIIQDTDLFSTYGYWTQPHWFESLGQPPRGLLLDATAFQSDLYIITDTNIPFERDPLRYGGDVREHDTAYWTDLCARHGLNYVVLKESDRESRKHEAAIHMRNLWNATSGQALTYDRKGL